MMILRLRLDFINSLIEDIFQINDGKSEHDCLELNSTFLSGNQNELSEKNMLCFKQWGIVKKS
jgi:hypothetical protein